MWQRLLRRAPSVDAVALVFIGGCSIWTVGDAYLEGAEPLRRHQKADESCSKQAKELLCQEQCRQLEQEGYLVIDNHLTEREVTDGLGGILRLEQQGFFRLSQNEKEHEGGDSPVRTDRVGFLSQHQSTDKGLMLVKQRLGEVAHGVAQSAFGGFQEEDSQKYSASQLGIPDRMQISIYDALANRPNEGAYYRLHLDTCSDNIFTMGLLGYLRSLYLRKRYLTCIVYLNDGDWEPDHGGYLRIIKADGSHVDVAPLPGRLVIFSSVHRWHAVLPTFRPRYACSLWLTLGVV